MHIHLPLVLEAILFSWIALYWLIYKILLRKKLSPLLVSLIANSDYGFMKVFFLVGNYYIPVYAV